MKKFCCVACLFFVMLNLIFSENNNSCWTQTIDTDGVEITYYLAKTEAQFKNNFPYYTKKKFNIEYDFQEPEYEKIYGSFINPKSENFKKNYPKVYRILSNSDTQKKLISEEFKYIWWYFFPQSSEADVFVVKRNSDNIYMSICAKYWSNYAYTYEYLNAFETLAP